MILTFLRIKMTKDVLVITDDDAVDSKDGNEQGEDGREGSFLIGPRLH